MTTSSPSHESESLDQQDRINPVVFYGSGLAILVFALWAMFFTEAAGTVIYAALAWISNSFGWFYFLAVVAYLVFVIAIACSRYGSIKLGPDHSEPEFNIVTWAAMLFSAGMGIGLMFFGVAEPVTHYASPPVGPAGTVESARQAMTITFFHWCASSERNETIPLHSESESIPSRITGASRFPRKTSGPEAMKASPCLKRSVVPGSSCRPRPAGRTIEPSTIRSPAAARRRPVDSSQARKRCAKRICSRVDVGIGCRSRAAT